MSYLEKLQVLANVGTGGKVSLIYELDNCIFTSLNINGSIEYRVHNIEDGALSLNAKNPSVYPVYKAFEERRSLL